LFSIISDLSIKSLLSVSGGLINEQKRQGNNNVTVNSNIENH